LRHSSRQVPIPLLLGVLLASAVTASAQLEISVVLEHNSFILGEAFTARVRVRNELDVPLVLDDDYPNAELFVELVREKSSGISESDRQPVRRQTVIMPGTDKLELVEITSLFNLARLGGYRLRVGVQHDGHVYRSAPTGFDLVEGIEMLTVRRGLRGYRDVDLTYSLRYWRRSGGEHAFFVIKDNASGAVYGTFRLGPVVRVNPPAIRFDKDGRAIVVHQSGRNRFTRSVIDVDSAGARMEGQTHHLEDGSPYPTVRVPPRETANPVQKGQK
jgi:hypothetical protein